MSPPRSEAERVLEFPIPEESLMRRVLLWRCRALLAGAGALTLDQVIMGLVLDVVTPDLTEDELRRVVDETKEAVLRARPDQR